MSRRIEDLLPEVQAKCQRLIVEAGLAGFPIVVCQTLRTFEEQELLYQQGRTRPGAIVTQARGGSSWHQYGRAFDVCFRVGDKGISWDGPWEQLGALGERLGLTWGGFWPKPKADRPHFEDTGGLTLAAARAAADFPVVA